MGETPGQFGRHRGFVVSGTFVGLAVQYGVERGLLGGDHLPQVLVDGAFGDGDVVVDGRSWPMRCSRFFICWVSPGVQACSAWMPIRAAVSVCPTPPAPIATEMTGAVAAGCSRNAALAASFCSALAALEA